MAGNQVLEWFDIDSEIKTANLKDVRARPPLGLTKLELTAFLQDPLAPPDLYAVDLICTPRLLTRISSGSSTQTSGKYSPS